MTLESSILAVAESINNLARALANKEASLAHASTGAEKPRNEIVSGATSSRNTKPNVEAAAELQPVAKTQPESPSVLTKDSVQSTATIEYSHVSAALMALVRKDPTVGRQKASEILKKFGVTNGKELKADQYSDVIAACESE